MTIADTDGTFDLIARVMERARLDARRGDVEAIEFLNLTTGDLDMTDHLTRLAIEATGFDGAAKQFETGRGKLYRPDGKPTFAAEEHAAREAALLEPLRRQYEAVKTAVDDALNEAERLTTIEHVDPYSALADADLQRAGHLLPLVQDFVAHAKLDELADRLTWAATHGAPVDQLLYLQAGQRRLTAIREAQRSNQLITTPGENVALRAIVEALGELAAHARPKVAADAARQAEQLRTKAMELSKMARELMTRLDGSDARARAAHAAWSAQTF